MEEGLFGQSPSLGSSTVMIPPQTTTTYTRMTFNNNKEKPLTAELAYAYKMKCTSNSDNFSSGNPGNAKNWTLSVHLINYYKPYSVIDTVGATGSAFCCCDCSFIGFRCCDRNVDTANDRCVVRKCPTHFRVCAKQGSGSEICSSTTSPFELNSNFTFSKGGTYGGLENPIQLTAKNSGSEVSYIIYSIIMLIIIIIADYTCCVYHGEGLLWTVF